MNNPVGWFEIYVDDMARAKAFYEKVFGAKFSKLESPGIEIWAFPIDPAAAGTAGSLVKMEGFRAGSNSVLVYFKCDDYAVEAKKAKDAGGRIQKEKMSVGEHGSSPSSSTARTT